MWREGYALPPFAFQGQFNHHAPCYVEQDQVIGGAHPWGMYDAAAP
jgi:hypothetical protein